MQCQKQIAVCYKVKTQRRSWMVLYFFWKYERQVCILHVWVKEWKSIGFGLFWPKKPIVKFNGAILFIVIITLCGQYRCYLYIHLLMSVSSDQTTYHSSLLLNIRLRAFVLAILVNTSAEMPWGSYNMKQYLHIASSQCRGMTEFST